MNKKRLLVTLILAVMTLALVFSQRFFSENLKQVALSDNNISSLKEYEIKEKGYFFSMPELWTITENKGNAYKLYSSNFKNEENNIMGYIEVLNTSEDVKVLAQKDIDNTKLKSSEERIENYSSKKYKGLKVEFKTKVKDGYSFINSTYYLKISDEEVLKYSFVSKKGYYKDNLNAIYDVIISSFRAS